LPEAVEAVGKNVTRSNQVMKCSLAATAFAEYVCPRADPSRHAQAGTQHFEQAASVNIAGITALQPARQRKKSSRAEGLINRRSGGVWHIRGPYRKTFARR